MKWEDDGYIVKLKDINPGDPLYELTQGVRIDGADKVTTAGVRTVHVHWGPDGTVAEIVEEAQT